MSKMYLSNNKIDHELYFYTQYCKISVTKRYLKNNKIIGISKIKFYIRLIFSNNLLHLKIITLCISTTRFELFKPVNKSNAFKTTINRHNSK